MLAAIFIVLCYTLLHFSCGQAIQYRTDKVRQYSTSGNDNAVELVITGDNGVKYLTSALGDQFVEAAMRKMDFSDISKRILVRKVTISDVRVTNFKKWGNRYNVQLMGGNRLKFDASNLQVTTSGTLTEERLLLIFLPNRVRSVRMTLDGLSLSLTMSIERTAYGYPRVVVNECRASLTSFSAQPKIVQWAAKTFHMMNEIKSKICKAARPVVDRMLRDMFKRQPLIFRFSELFPNLHTIVPKSPLIPESISNQLKQVFQNLQVDLRLTKNPQFSTNNGAAVYLKGDMLWGTNGVKVVPFFPNPIPNIQQQMGSSRVGKMAQIAISDYTINSFFYQAMKNVGLKMTIDFQQLPVNVRELINVGLPDLGPQYTNLHNRRLEISAVRAPVANVSPSKITLFADFHISLFVDRTEIFQILIDIQADVKVQVSSPGLITGSMNIPTRTGQLKKSLLKNFQKQDDVNKLAELVALIVETLLNEQLLKKGVKFPVNKFFNFYNLDMKLGDRFILVGSDFTVKSIF